MGVCTIFTIWQNCIYNFCILEIFFGQTGTECVVDSKSIRLKSIIDISYNINTSTCNQLCWVELDVIFAIFFAEYNFYLTHVMLKYCFLAIMLSNQKAGQQKLPKIKNKKTGFTEIDRR